MPKETTITKKIVKNAPKAVKSDVFAVIATGGKQYKVAVGDRVKIEIMPGNFSEGDSITFDKVLLVEDGKTTNVGEPNVAGAKVEGKLVKISRYPTVTVIKYKQKSRYFKKNGHRQRYFEVEIGAIK
jgi:large subunit ribosomal protein L21